MEWKAIIKKDDAMVIPYNWIHIHYYEALNALFRIENSLRVFVYIVLKNEFLDKWDDITILSDDSEPIAIKSIAKKRIHQAQSYGYLGYVIHCPIMHLTSGELIRLITHENYWPYFKRYFPTTKDIVKLKLEEVGVIRNSLAHFRPIKEEDVELIKQNAKQVLTGVEKCLEQLGPSWNLVPSNTTDEWYLELKDISNARCNLIFNQSVNEEWIDLIFRYQCTILNNRAFGPDHRQYRILNLVSPSIISCFGNLAKYATFLREEAVSSDIRYSEQNPIFSKQVNIFISRKLIALNYRIIKNEIESLFKTVEEESTLLINDNLARGKIISSVNVWANRPKQVDDWVLQTNTTLCQKPGGNFPEYWGNLELYSSMLTDAQQYPWMPVEISRSDIPF